ncbi:MAG TPA: EI24 domain-containing protein [Thermohalobaculum sp.]|nr:EI24 domain-containing protein [Thermohalobaculum sp.]
MGLIGDFLRALGQVFDGRFLGVLVRALGLTLALLAALSVGAVWLIGLLPETLDLPLIGEFATPVATLRALTLGAVLLLSAFLMFPVAAAFIGLFVDAVADAVEARHYPGLAAPRRTGIAEEIGAATRFMLLVLGANALAFVLYLPAGPFAPLVFWAVNGYLLGREYFELVAARRLGPEAVGKLRRRHRFTVWAAGTLMAVPLSVPVLNLVIPVIGVATFTHLFHRLWRREDITSARAVSGN